MDYTLEALEFQVESNRQFNEALLLEMQQESDFILSCIDSMSVVAEATTDPKKKQNIFKRIMEFVKKVFTAFTQKAKALVGGNKEWLNQNLPKLSKIDYSAIEISMVPFWNFNSNRMQSEANSISNMIFNQMKSSSAKKLTRMEDVKAKVFGKYLDENGDLAGGFKNFYRTGNARGPVKSVVLKGSQLKSVITSEFSSFVKNYETTVVPFLRNASSRIEREFNVIDKKVEKVEQDKLKGTKESYFLIEGAHFDHSSIAYLPVMEADAKKPEDKDKKPSPTKVEVVNHGTKEDLQKKDVVDGMNADELAYAKNLAHVAQISIAALMTVFEERYNAYMNAIKAVLKEKKKDIAK